MHAPRNIDLTGRKFGRWQVVSRHPERSRQRHDLWFCRCDCGTESIVFGHALRRGKSTNCGCTSHNFIGLANNRFGRWQVLATPPERKRYGAVWRCRCDCGTERLVLGFRLRSGQTRSCGCLKREKIKHGHARRGKRTRPYNCCLRMKERCGNPNHQAYDNYGGRPDNPITVDEYYRDFLNWYADIGYRLHDNHLSQDRIDNDSGYRPGNVRAADTATQLANRRPYKKRKTKRAAPSEDRSADDNFEPPPF